MSFIINTLISILMNMIDDCVIMAGGSGTRLWPASSSRLPKQFLPASGNKSFFSLALERAFAVTGKNGRVIIITGKAHIPHVVAEAAKLKPEQKKRLVVIGEPVAKNTAPAIACAVVYSLFGKQNRNMLVLTSDHIIKPMKIFKSNAASAAASAEKGKLVVFGIPPSRAETGYGYIETSSEKQSASAANVAGVASVFDVAAFHEKPDTETAKKYVEDSRFFWNSGMFAFSAEFMADCFRSLAPDVFLPFEKLKMPKSASFAVSRGVRVINAWQGLENAYRKAKSISFDYAIAEKCPKTVMVRTGFDWIDIGNWEEYVKVCGNENSQVYSVSSENNFVDSDIPVALAGVEDLIVVIRSGKNGQPAAALVTRKGQTQKVREIAEKLKKEGRKDLL